MNIYITLILISTLFSFGTCDAPKKNSQPQIKTDTTYTYGKRSSDGIGKYYLKTDGAILLLEFRAEDASIAIKPHHKMTIVQANKEMEANGFQLAYSGDFLPIQHFLLYKKK